MSQLLRGNFDVKRQIESSENINNEDELKKEFRKKALESIGGSMVFVERDKLFWEEVEPEENK